MGWFLQKPKSPKRKTTRASEYEQWSRERTLRRLRQGLWLSILMFLALGWRFGEDRLLAFVGMRGHVMQRQHVELVDAPAWLSEAVKDNLTHLVATHITADPLDGVCLQRASKALALNPWIATVDRIRRTDQGMRVWATFRKPVALVRLPRADEASGPPIQWDDRFRLVDKDGYVLPSDTLGVIDPPYEMRHLRQIDLPILVDVEEEAPAAGQRWNHEVVAAGLKLILLLSKESFSDQILAYGAERDQRGRIRLVLRTHQRGKVRWGLPPGEENMIEDSAEMKRKKLLVLHFQKGAIDAKGRVVDIYGPGIIIQPLSPQRSADGALDRLNRGESIRQSRYNTRR